MKNIVKDRFDTIGIVITNNRGEIEINLMEKLKLTISNIDRNSKALLPSDTGLDSNFNKNSPLGHQIIKKTILVMLKI